MTDASLNTLYLALLAVLAAIPTITTLYFKYREVKLAQNKEPVDLMTQSLTIVKSAAEDVLSKSTRIRDLEQTVSALKDRLDQLETSKRHVEEELELVKRKVAALESDKQRLETENAVQLQRIAVLEEENRAKQKTIIELTERVKKLEQILRDNNIPIPNGGPKIDTGPLVAR